MRNDDGGLPWALGKSAALFSLLGGPLGERIRTASGCHPISYRVNE